MTLGFSLILIAIGAILAFAVNYQVVGFDINAAGVILMVIGLIGLVMWMLFWAQFSPFAESVPVYRRRRTYHDEPETVVHRTDYDEPETVVRRTPERYREVVREEEYGPDDHDHPGRVHHAH